VTWTVLRWGWIPTFVLAVVLCAFSAVAGADSFTWSAPTPVGGGSSRVGGLACPSSSLCVAVSTGGELDTSSEDAFPPSDPSGQTSTALVNGFSLGMTACASEAVCDSAVGGDVASFSTSDPGPTTPVNADPSATFPTTDGGEFQDSGVISSLACASALVCVATDAGGAVVTFPPSSPGSATSPVLVDENLVGQSSGGVKGIACPAANQCTLIDDDGGEVTFDPGPPVSGATFTTIAGANSAIACPATTQCTAVGTSGSETTFNPQTGATTNHATVDPFTSGENTDLAAVACPLVTQCTAVDGAGREVTFDPTAAAPATPTVIDQGVGLAGIQCPSAQQCLIWDTPAQSGLIWLGTAPAPTGTTTTGTTTTTPTTTTPTTTTGGTGGGAGGTGGNSGGHAIKVQVVTATSIQHGSMSIGVTNPNGYTMISGAGLYTGVAVFYTGGDASASRAAAKRKPVLIASANATIAPHHTAKLHLKLSRKALAYLKHHSLEVTLVLTLKATGQLTTTVRRSLTLRLK
jgi:hypothetical protein